MKIKIFFIAFMFFIMPLAELNACDDTLIVLLTAQNPSSEFSKSIRSFMRSLTLLGNSLKNNTNPPFDKELKNVMSSWLEFAKKYMANPPEEAKNDLRWVEKTNKTAKSVGEIRKYISEKEYGKAHDMVLALSVQIDEFFEYFGVSDEKQIFLKTSSEIVNLRRFILAFDYDGAEKKIFDIEKALNDFKSLLPEDENARSDYSEAIKIKDSVIDLVKKRFEPKEIDLKISELQVIIEKLRSTILMQEWFSAD